jgi:hypothetical protein
MSLNVKDKLLMSLKSPYVWMVRGVIALAGILYTPWMFALLPLSELVVQTWFDALFRTKLDEKSQGDAAQERERLAGQLSKEDRYRFSKVTACLDEIEANLKNSAYTGQVDCEELARDFFTRMISLRNAQKVEQTLNEEVIGSAMKEEERSLKAETNDRLRAVIAERLALQKQRVELGKKVSMRTRELEAQLRLVEEQILLLRDTVLTTGVHSAQGGVLDSHETESGVSEKIEVLSRQLRVCSELDDEMQTVLRGAPQRAEREG